MVSPDGRKRFQNGEFAAGWELFRTSLKKIPGKYPLAVIGIVGIIVSLLVTDVSSSPWFLILSGVIIAFGFYGPIIRDAGEYAVWTRRRL